MPKRCPHVPQVLTSSFVLWRKKSQEVEGAGVPQHFPWKTMPRKWLPLSTLTRGSTVGDMAAALPGA